MTLEEAIKHAEEVEEYQKELYMLCPASESEISCCDGTKDCKVLMNGEDKGCRKCAEEHRQLAEWLKDYRRLLDRESQTEKDINMRRPTPEEIESVNKYVKSINKSTGGITETV